MFRLLASLVLAASLHAQTPPKLVVISIDGLDARFLTDPALRVKVPNIRKLMRQGALATVIGVAPSDTWPAHGSLVTGVVPSQHGITANEVPGRPGERFFAASAFRVPTLWDAATKAGLKTGLVYWPSSLGARVAFDLPEYWETRQGNAITLANIVQKSTPPGLADGIEKMFPRFDKELWDDASAAQAATWLLTTEQPAVLFVHFAEADAEQHETTALSIYAREILENDDELIGQMIAKVGPNTAVVVLSDHGFENSNYVVRPRVMLKQANVKGTVEVEDGLIGTSDPAVAAYLRKLIGLGRKSGIAREVPMKDVRARVPGLSRWVAAFDTMPNFVASAEETGSAVGAGRHQGVHGFWPERPNYRSVFIFAGTGIRPMKLGEIDMLQIAPTLADVLGVKLDSARAASLWRTMTR